MDTNSDNKIQNSSIEQIPKTKEKQSKSLIVIMSITIVILAVAVIAMAFLIRNENEKISNMNPNQGELILTEEDDDISKEEVKGVITVYGEIQTSGLSDVEKEMYGLNGENYQITYLGEIQSDKVTTNDDYQRFFISIENTDSILEKYWGSCVRLTGKFQIDENDQLVKVGYGNENPILVMGTVEEVGRDMCNKTYTQAPTELEMYDGSFTGKLERNVRPAYDITYDYKLVLDEPTEDFPNGSGMPTSNVVILPLADVAEDFEMLIGEKVNVEGYQSWGYAESSVFIVSEISKVE